MNSQRWRLNHAEFLVAKVDVLVALGTVSVAILSPLIWYMTPVCVLFVCCQLTDQFLFALKTKFHKVCDNSKLKILLRKKHDNFE